MNQASTLRDLYRHFDWAGDRVLSVSETLAEDELDRRFDIGLGSLRATLWHNWAAHWIWFQRIDGHSPARFEFDGERASLAELRQFIDRARITRRAKLDAVTDTDLVREIPYANLKGERFSRQLGEILLHVTNHAMHHHAQALNMLRHSGIAKPPRLDYLFMYHENPGSPPPTLSIGLVGDYLAYADWARQVVMSVAAELDEAALDRPFEMGMGSIRRNLLHTHAVELFWLRNWQGDHDSPFPSADERVSLSEIRERCNATATAREQFLAGGVDDDLLKPARAKTPDGRLLEFPLGVIAIQLCNHGTHHRAQTINMLRRLGKSTPATDLTLWKHQLAQHR
jgi:uncharacterized damage-inducible protein DinB